MRRTLIATMAALALAVAAVGVLSLTTPPVEAVGCPPPNQVPLTNIQCGGYAGIPCPGNLICVDNPFDNCCPQSGGADCGGLCAKPRVKGPKQKL